MLPRARGCSRHRENVIDRTRRDGTGDPAVEHRNVFARFDATASLVYNKAARTIPSSFTSGLVNSDALTVTGARVTGAARTRPITSWAT